MDADPFAVLLIACALLVPSVIMGIKKLINEITSPRD